MSRALAAIILEVALCSLSEGLAPVSHTPARTVTLPVERGFVTVSIDGQKVELLVDSGAHALIVLDGHWYEGMYGKGACEKSGSGCFFCPVEAPCEFSGAEERTQLRFVDGTMIESISRRGSLVLGERDAVDVIYKISRPMSPSRLSIPRGYFGLSRRPTVSTNRESLLESLVQQSVIQGLSFTIRPSEEQLGRFISGQLILGGTVNLSEATNYMLPGWPDDPVNHRAIPAVWVTSVDLLDARGSPTTEGATGHRHHRCSFRAALDTGANSMNLPHPGLLEDIERELITKMREKGYTEERIGRLWGRTNKGFVHVRSRALEFLPVLALTLGGEENSILIKIRPKHYCTHIVGGCFILFVQEHVSGYLGTPFFAAYSVHVDYTNNRTVLLEN
ncbi:hypothetical protein FOZ62_007986 [Perkinsus olseni]|uniref:Uncharacterized protein n=1 Tax=Perkinsus olseni TaxID=32597 RepID=A0A7J6T6S4_PEROL|nr:hypothetical protein FOZ62_007986 [Perkinsus olseni]